VTPERKVARPADDIVVRVDDQMHTKLQPRVGQVALAGEPDGQNLIDHEGAVRARLKELVVDVVADIAQTARLTDPFDVGIEVEVTVRFDEVAGESVGNRLAGALVEQHCGAAVPRALAGRSGRDTGR